MLAQRRRLSGKATLSKALQYALNRWDALVRHLEDGRLSIDNNLSERLLRGIAVTRKNYLFVGSDAGGQRAASIYTIAQTAMLNGLVQRPTSLPSSTGSLAAIPSTASTSCCPGTSGQTVNPPEWADAYSSADSDYAAQHAVGRAVVDSER
jgi:Transposase IS66 family